MARNEIRHVGLTWHSAGDEIVIPHLEKSTYLKLNDTAAVAWECPSTATAGVELTTALVALFGIADGPAAGDVAKFRAGPGERDLVAG
jgi:hypothetical protein